MAPHILPRRDFAITNDYIAASIIAGAIVAISLLCLLCHFLLQRSKANKERSAASSCVRGVVRPMMIETYPSSKSTPPFSRNGLTASIVMPEKSIARKPHSYGLSNKTVASSQLTPSPNSSTRPLHPLPRPHPISIISPAHPQHSRSSSGFSGYAKYAFSLGLSSRLSSASFASPSQARPVHQPFEPVLPDELTLRCGEYLAVLRSFDDGWCLVARDTSRSSRAATGMKNNGDNIDVGLVPAWVFAGPLEGITASRPFRSTSLNALRTGHTPTSARDGVLSWANFA